MDNKDPRETTHLEKRNHTRTIIKKCHVCGHINESTREIEKCGQCGKSFLPLNYFTKIHGPKGKYEDLFCDVDELCDTETIKGLYVIW
ncbi:MAG: hypothetical protein H6621_12585 [Halobacteriovoraceae bacterium]|nr:hypothetical protein [Halobacteriovoraceae bacterium]